MPQHNVFVEPVIANLPSAIKRGLVCELVFLLLESSRCKRSLNEFNIVPTISGTLDAAEAAASEVIDVLKPQQLNIVVPRETRLSIYEYSIRVCMSRLMQELSTATDVACHPTFTKLSIRIITIGNAEYAQQIYNVRHVPEHAIPVVRKYAQLAYRLITTWQLLHVRMQAAANTRVTTSVAQDIDDAVRAAENAPQLMAKKGYLVGRMSVPNAILAVRQHSTADLGPWSAAIVTDDYLVGVRLTDSNGHSFQIRDACLRIATLVHHISGDAQKLPVYVQYAFDKNTKQIVHAVARNHGGTVWVNLLTDVLYVNIRTSEGIWKSASIDALQQYLHAAHSAKADARTVLPPAAELQHDHVHAVVAFLCSDVFRRRV